MKIDLKKGDIVQLDPDTVKNKMFTACLMIVTEPKEWGAQGYVQALGKNGDPGGQAYYRATWEEMHLVGSARTVAPALIEAKAEIERLRRLWEECSEAIDILCTETHFGSDPPKTAKTFINANRRNNAIEKAQGALKAKGA